MRNLENDGDLSPGLRIVRPADSHLKDENQHNFLRQPFDAYGYPGTPYYLSGGAAKEIGDVVDVGTLYQWAKNNRTSWGLKMDAVCIHGHWAIPQDKVLEIKKLLPDRAALDTLVEQYRAEQRLLKSKPSIDFRQEPFEAQDYAGSPFYSTAGAAKKIGSFVKKKNVSLWARKNRTPWGLRMNAVLIRGNWAIPEAKVLEIVKLLPNRAALDALVEGYRARPLKNSRNSQKADPAETRTNSGQIPFIPLAEGTEILGDGITLSILERWVKEGTIFGFRFHVSRIGDEIMVPKNEILELKGRLKRISLEVRAEALKP